MSGIGRKIYWTSKKLAMRFFPEIVIDSDWKKWKGYPVDWKNPRDINEKIQWLMCRSDTSLWTVCADKYRVREYVASKGLGDILVPLLGVWKRAEDVDFESLPEKFVIKCNHDSGSTHIVDKSSPDYNPEAIRRDLKKHLKIRFGNVGGEMFYNSIPPRIIAEKTLELAAGSVSMTDYKVWSFDGKPYVIMTCQNRTESGLDIDVYDTHWNERRDACVFSSHYRESGEKLPPPASLERMLSAASVLSKGFPEVRVDFYDVEGKLYFGELTFSSLSGRMTYFTQPFLEELGAQCILPNTK